MSVDKYSRYDVYLAKLPKVSGSVQHGIRPVVIYNVSDYDPAWDEYITTLNCYGLTTKEKNKLPVHFLIKADRSCLKEDSTFLAEQALILHEENLIEKWGNIADKEYRYMMYKTISIQLASSSPVKPMFKYTYKFLEEAEEPSQELEAIVSLIKREDTKDEFRNVLKSYYEPAKNMVRDVCKKHNVIADRYMKDLSDSNIDFSLLNL